MNIFDSCPKIYFGDQSLNYLYNLKNEKVLIVTDPFMVSSNTINLITHIFRKTRCKYTVFSGVVPDPPVSVISDGVQMTLSEKPDVLIAFGGGSAIDAAKAILYFCMKFKEQVMDKKYVHRPFFIAIPTTSGTGSEVTSYAVITDEKNNTKIAISDNAMLPNVAILNPEFTRTLPLDIVANTGMDVLTHAVESYVAKGANDFSNMYAKEAFKQTIETLLPLYNNLENSELREKMYTASTMAGIAFNNSGLGLNHSIAHAIGGEFHIPHGKANSIIMPYIIAYNAGLTKYNSDGVSHLYSQLAKEAGINTGDEKADSKALVMLVNALNTQFAIEPSLKALGIDRSDFVSKIPAIVDKIMLDICTPPNPLDIDNETAVRLLMDIFEGNNIWN